MTNSAPGNASPEPDALASDVGPARSAGRYDLHTHTTASDGVYAPRELIRLSKEAGLAGIAVTDHDTFGGLDEAAEAGREFAVEVVPGVELTSYAGKTEVHVVGLFVDPGSDAEAVEKVASLRSRRRKRMLEMIAKLDKMGVHVEPEDVMALAPDDASVGRPHLATALVSAGHVADASEAFDRYIGNTSPVYVPKARLEPEEAIRLVKRLGGLPIFAHPAVSKLDGRLPEFKDVGLGGIEVWHPRHGPSDIERYSRLAETHGLVPSGGSDFHGPGRTEAPLGCFKIGREVLDALKACHAKLGN